MSELDKLLSVAEAIAILDAEPIAIRPAALAPLEKSVGLRLAKEIVADRDYPPVDKSQMDGYAVRSADTRQTPVILKEAGRIAAGSAAAGPIGAGETMAIMTGAVLPAGADAVVPIEEVEPTGQGIRIARATEAGKFVLKRGSEISAGQTILPVGTKMRPARMAAASSVGAAEVSVFPAVRVAVLATGDELTSINQSPSPTQIRNGNSPMLVALLRELGCVVRDLGVARDKPEQIRAAISEGLKDEVLFVTGGMSVGEFDFTPRVLAELGGLLRISKLRIKPGKPFVFAAMPGGKYVFGLPGNPLSAFVCVVRLASRFLDRMAGGNPEDRTRQAILTAALPANGPREFYQPALLDGPKATPLGWKGSSDVFSLAKANGLIVRPAAAAPAEIGAAVAVLEI